MSNKMSRTLASAALAVVTVGVLGACATSPEQACTVESKDRAASADGPSSYRVYTDCGVFTVEDAPLLGQWNAADTYASIEPGGTYEFTTYGFRMPFFSAFPNITQAVKAEAVQP